MMEARRVDQLAPYTSVLQLGPSVPLSEGEELVSKWALAMADGARYLDSFGGWSVCVPRYLGRSEPLDKAAMCFIEARRASVAPTAANLDALRRSNIRAVVGVRHSLEERRNEGSYRGDILLAVHLLSTAEVSCPAYVLG
jgi:hypothetical protein